MQHSRRTTGRATPGIKDDAEPASRSLKEDSAGVRSDFPFAETALFTSRRGDKSSAVAAPDLAHQHTDRREGGREEADGKLYPLDDEKDQNISCGIQIFSCSRLRAMLNCPLKLFSAPEAINPSPRALLVFLFRLHGNLQRPRFL